ncbi:MAG: dienelactone hydrolase family protein [Herpetosiphonaceae bacterium]|nr:dienelactone hydrolase family protein [Herpetosiphonaceae bacterium]
MGALRQLPGPVLAFYGAEDQGMPAEAREHLDLVLREQNVPHEVIIYPGVGHAFMNDTRAHGYNAAAADGWQRMIRFFKRYLEA